MLYTLEYSEEVKVPTGVLPDFYDYYNERRQSMLTKSLWIDSWPINVVEKVERLATTVRQFLGRISH